MDPLHVEQCLVNLWINARDAIEGKGTLTMALRMASCGGCPCTSCHQPVKGSDVELAVSDTGPGIPSQVPEHMEEESVPEFMQDLLTGWGLGVVTTGNGVEACEQFAADPDGFDLVVLDQTMPRMAGLEAAEPLVKLRPALHVILYTDYSEHISEARLSAAGIHCLVKKPLDVPAFRLLLEGILADSPPTSRS